MPGLRGRSVETCPSKPQGCFREAAPWRAVRRGWHGGVSIGGRPPSALHEGCMGQFRCCVASALAVLLTGLVGACATGPEARKPPPARRGGREMAGGPPRKTAPNKYGERRRKVAPNSAPFASSASCVTTERGRRPRRPNAPALHGPGGLGATVEADRDRIANQPRGVRWRAVAFSSSWTRTATGYSPGWS
jgi:hypothetical protein